MLAAAKGNAVVTRGRDPGDRAVRRRPAGAEADDRDGSGHVQADPTTRVSAPAIGLMVAGGLSAGFTLLYILFVAIIGVAAIADKEAADALPGVGIMVGFATIKLALDALTIFAGYQMRQLRSWGLSLAGAVTALLPCSICCIIGLPMGIWAIVVLIDQDVKRNFVS